MGIVRILIDDRNLLAFGRCRLDVHVHVSQCVHGVNEGMLRLNNLGCGRPTEPGSVCAVRAVLEGVELVESRSEVGFNSPCLPVPTLHKEVKRRSRSVIELSESGSAAQSRINVAGQPNHDVHGLWRSQ